MEDFLTVFGPTRVLDTYQILFGCLISFLLSSTLATVYRWTFRGLSYSRSFIHTIILSSIVSCVLIMAIGNNLARGLGILGTLALIRFRTPIRDPRDIIFLFASLAIGIAAGAAVFPVAIVGTLFFCFVALYLHWSPFATRRHHDGLLRYTAIPSPECESAARGVLSQWCATHELVAVREAAQGELMEYSYQVRLMDPGHQSGLLDALHSIDGVSDATLLLQRSTVEI